MWQGGGGVTPPTPTLFFSIHTKDMKGKRSREGEKTVLCSLHNAPTKIMPTFPILSINCILTF
jgi:hypothetical protein